MDDGRTDLDVVASWQDFASCLGVDPDLFFPERGASTIEAKEVCRGCLAREQCLEYALVNGERFGIWGGMSVRERRRLRGTRRRQQTVLVPAAPGCDDEVTEELDQADDVTSTSTEVEVSRTDEVSRVCAVCSNELAPNRLKTCSAECAREYKRRAKAGSRRTSVRAENGSARTSAVNGARAPLAWEPLRALVTAGAQVRSVELDLGGQRWTLTRSNGAS